MHSIIEIKKDVETIIANVTNQNDLINYVRDSLRGETYIYIPKRMDVTINELAKGKYLLFIDDVLTYMEVFKNISEGYIYNSTQNVCFVICKWKLVLNNTLQILNDGYKCEDVTDIKNFNLYLIKPNSKVIIIGNRGTGKTTIAKNIMDTFSGKFIDNSLLMSSDNMLLSNIRWISEYDAIMISEFIDNGKNGCLILDDCVNSFMLMRDNDLMMRLFKSNKMVIVIMQNVYDGIEGFEHDYYFLTDKTCKEKMCKDVDITGLEGHIVIDKCDNYKVMSYKN